MFIIVIAGVLGGLLFVVIIIVSSLARDIEPSVLIIFGSYYYFWLFLYSVHLLEGWPVHPLISCCYCLSVFHLTQTKFIKKPRFSSKKHKQKKTEEL